MNFILLSIFFMTGFSGMRHESRANPQNRIMRRSEIFRYRSIIMGSWSINRLLFYKFPGF
jgi:hypothetical protein